MRRRTPTRTAPRERTRPAPVVSAPIAPLLLHVPEAAAMLNICERRVWTLLSRGTIYSVLVGRSRLIPRRAVEEYVESLIAGAA